jgi:hypothetical protein
MELWLLGAGAIVLIGITLWIVWPARAADAAVGTTVRGEEVSTLPMAENVRRGTTPQGDQFEDQYTSATADLSAGGVAAAVGSLQTEPSGEPWPAADIQNERIGQAERSENYLRDAVPAHESRSLAQPRTVGLGAGVLLSLTGAIGGAWLYARWHRERNKPINRLRRGAHDVATRLGERMPDLDELPHGAAPLGGAASALLLTALLGTRALRRGDSDDHTEAVRQQARELLQESVREAFGRGRHAMDLGRDVVARRGEAKGMGRSMLERGRKESQRMEPRQPMFMGLGFGGLAIVVGGMYLVWRLVRGGSSSRTQNWYSGE